MGGIGCSSVFPDTVPLKNPLNFSLLSESQLPPMDHTREKAKAACNYKGGGREVTHKNINWNGAGANVCEGTEQEFELIRL